MRLAATLALTTFLAGCATLPASPTQTAFDPARLSHHVEVLSSDAFEGRGPATPGEQKAVDYIVSQFKEVGLQPGGDTVGGVRQWTQAVPLLRSEHKAPPVITLRSSTGARTLAQAKDISLRAPMNGQSAVSLSGAPLVFVGYGVSAPERGWDDFKGVDVKGKILVELINDPDFEGGEGDFGGKAMTYYGRWTYKYEEAARRGAAGVMIIHEDAPASYGWNTVKNSNTNTMFDIVRANPAAAHTGFESWITRDTGAAIFKAAGLDLATAKAAARRKDFRLVDLKASLDARVSAATSTINTRNIIGMLPGRTHPDETLIYSGHYDHLGVGEPDAKGDRIYNGAVDNATGIAQIIEQARAFAAEPRPERTVAFMALAAEEKGLLGSTYYAANPVFPIGRTVGVINTDALGVSGPARDFSISGSAKLGLLDMLTEEMAKAGRGFLPDSHPEAGGFFRSDHFPFAKAGVPAISFESGHDLVVGGTARADAIGKDYTDNKYHQPADEWSPTMDFTGIAADAAILHAFGMRLANSRDWPNWASDSEFRALRDKTAGERR